METTKREDMMIIAALVRFSRDFEPADEDLAIDAWELAQEIAAEHGMTAEEAVPISRFNGDLGEQ
jgi:hypothetical protein